MYFSGDFSGAQSGAAGMAALFLCGCWCGGVGVGACWCGWGVVVSTPKFLVISSRLAVYGDVVLLVVWFQRRSFW
jgi:hypothetical protein